MDCSDLPSNRFDKPLRIDTATNPQETELPLALEKGTVDSGLRLDVEWPYRYPHPSNIADHSHNCQTDRSFASKRAVAKQEPLANRRLVRPKAACHGSIDGSDAWR